MSSFSQTATAAITGTAATTLVAAPGAGAFINVYNVVLSNSSAVATNVDILDGSTIIILKVSNPAGLGNNMKFDKPIRLAENSPLNVQCSVGVTTANVTVIYDLEPDGNG